MLNLHYNLAFFLSMGQETSQHNRVVNNLNNPNPYLKNELTLKEFSLVMSPNIMIPDLVKIIYSYYYQPTRFYFVDKSNMLCMLVDGQVCPLIKICSTNIIKDDDINSDDNNINVDTDQKLRILRICRSGNYIFIACETGGDILSNYKFYLLQYNISEPMGKKFKRIKISHVQLYRFDFAAMITNNNGNNDFFYGMCDDGIYQHRESSQQHKLIAKYQDSYMAHAETTQGIYLFGRYDIHSSIIWDIRDKCCMFFDYKTQKLRTIANSPIRTYSAHNINDKIILLATFKGLFEYNTITDTYRDLNIGYDVSMQIKYELTNYRQFIYCPGILYFISQITTKPNKIWSIKAPFEENKWIGPLANYPSNILCTC